MMRRYKDKSVKIIVQLYKSLVSPDPAEALMTSIGNLNRSRQPFMACDEAPVVYTPHPPRRGRALKTV